MACAAAAMGLGERRSRTGRDLDSVAVAALTAELAAALAAEPRYRRLNITPPLANEPATTAEQVAGTGLGTLLPLGLHLVSPVLTRRRSRLLSGAAFLAILGGSLAMRCGIMAADNRSALRPDVSLRFAQPAKGRGEVSSRPSRRIG